MISASAEGIRTIFISLVVNVVLCVTKVSVGVFARSHALVADGIHSLVDLGYRGDDWSTHCGSAERR